MNKAPLILACSVAAASAVLLSTTAVGQASCPPGVSDPAYCSSTTSTALTTASGSDNSLGDNPPPATPPAVQPAVEGDPPLIAGTLSKGTTTTIEMAGATNGGITELSLNLAGEGTLIVQAGAVRITVTVERDGTTTIRPSVGSAITVNGANGHVAGTITVRIAPEGVTYTLSDPGYKRVGIGGGWAIVPDAATITVTPEGRTVYVVKGSGNCLVDLDPAAPNKFSSADAVACAISSVGSVQTRRLRAREPGPAWNLIRTGDRRDLISAGRGNDYVHTGGGDDRVKGGAGDDVIFGQSGDDRIFGGGGNDRLHGASGDDHIHSGSGRDRVWTGSGDDVINVRGHGRDTVNCGTGRDVVFAGANDPVLIGCERVVRGPEPR